MAAQVVDFLRSQGRLLPEDVKDGAWTEVSRLISNQKTLTKSNPLGALMPPSSGH
jgi:hypothetical protein